MLNNLISKIAQEIIAQGKQECNQADSFQTIVDYDIIDMKYSTEIAQAIEEAITDTIAQSKEVAEVIADTDGFDIVYYTDSVDYQEDEEE